MELLLPQQPEKKIAEEDLNLFWATHKNKLGWCNLEKLRQEVPNIKEKGRYIRANCDVFLVVGIGGSYLGARAVIDALNPYFEDKNPEICYVGNSLSSAYLHDLENYLQDKEIIINYVSKSGTTLESKIAFEYLYRLMQKRYDENELKKRIIYTTGDETLVGDHDWFPIPDDIGGRYSVFTAAGLLPMAVAGIDIAKIVAGAQQAELAQAKEYALYRAMMEEKGWVIEALVVYEPKLFYLLEWLKQLFAESLGKENGGIFPVSLINTTDLHSIGQYLQEGRTNIMETVISFADEKELWLPEYNRCLREVNDIAKEATKKAHQTRLPNAEIKLDPLNEETVGRLLQFFMLSCAINGFLQGVNPFNQAGVEVYKANIRDMFKVN